ncbi:MAG: CDP-glycerol glycerophosphotransferase family protein [Bacteroides sp.]|jgi:CDP-glycerol glycerophosphotransferase (TagB/SpsB family)|nr:CDP-glycerol glycerophosphotransferase family protein [Bacteroides sp.]
MVVTGILLKFPYWLGWQLRRLMRGPGKVAFYLDSEHDHAVIEHILPHLNFPFDLVARNLKVASALRKRGIAVKTWPVFPPAVIMARHALHRFPIKAVRKAGLKHGPHFFKKMIRAEKFNAFDLFIFISENEVGTAKKNGVRVGVAGGYPRLDAFSHPKTIALSEKILKQPGFDSSKKTLLFTATWDQSGMSAVDRWIDELQGLKERFNLLVSLHPMMSEEQLRKAKAVPGIFLASPEDLPACMLAADFLIGDTSSVLAEFCALDKPIITFRVDTGRRLSSEIRQMISEISLQIDKLEELDQAILRYQENPQLKQSERQRWNKIFFDNPSGSHGKKVAAILNQWVQTAV